MKYNRRYNKDKVKNVKMAKTIILFIITAVFVVGGSTLLALKISKDKQQTVQAAEIDSKVSSEATNDQINPQSTNKNDNSQIDSKLSSSDKSSQVNDKLNLVEKDPVADDVAFVEKYLDQQMKGQKPDGADGKKVVYLTFDDGPSETVTPRILDTLKAENVHATFFLVGKAIDESETNKNLVKREVAEGNAIGNHTYSHNYNYLYPKGNINVDNCMADI